MVHLLFSAKSWSSSRLIVIPMSCACKGIRSCLVCEEKSVEEKQRRASAGNNYYFCGDCGKINPEAETSFQEASAPICLRQCDGYRREIRVADRSMRENLTFGGIALLKDFLSPREEEELVSYIDSTRWVESQSGRRKQDFGPKVNFKKQKIRLDDDFDGLPDYIKPFIAKINQLDLKNPFRPVELCNLEYNPDRGSSIDPHFDDSWLWGKRLVTLNLLSSTLLTFTHPNHHQYVVHVPLPRRSLVLIEGPARHDWMHSIQRRHVVSRRVAITLRELSAEFSCGGEKEELGKTLLARAL